MTNENSVVLNDSEKQAPVQHAITSLNPETLIAQAITKGLPVETMERLLAMRKELKAEFAKEQFDQAMANFQRDCPVINKNKSVLERNSTKARYKFASLDSIVDQTRKVISENGLSYSIKTKIDDKMFTATVRVAHIAGHSEESDFSIPIGTEQFMSDVQKFGARSTFAKRYAFLNAFGIMTGDEDQESSISSNDNVKTNADTLKPSEVKNEMISPEQIKELNNELIRTAKTLQGLLTHLGKSKITELTAKEAKTWIISLRAKPDLSNVQMAKASAEVVEGEIVEEMPPKTTAKKIVPKDLPAGEEPGPMRKAWEKTQAQKAKTTVVGIEDFVPLPEDVCKLINLYDGVPETDLPEGFAKLRDDCNAGTFKSKADYPNLF